MSTSTAEGGLAGPSAELLARRTPGRAFVAIAWRDISVTARGFVAFLMETLLSSVFLLFIFGRILPDLGFASPNYADVLLPGTVAFTIVLTAMQGVALPLVLEFGYTKEVEDRLLSPLPVWLVAGEKLLFAALRGFVAGILILPLGILIVPGESLSGDHLPRFVLFFLISGLLGATIGMTLGTFVEPRHIHIMFAVIFTPLFFTGCTQYPWATLDSLRWFQIVTLFNPLTYASEGLRGALAPQIEHMNWQVAAVVCLVSIAVFGAVAVRGFLRRSVD